MVDLSGEVALLVEEAAQVSELSRLCIPCPAASMISGGGGSSGGCFSFTRITRVSVFLSDTVSPNSRNTFTIMNGHHPRQRPSADFDTTPVSRAFRAPHEEAFTLPYAAVLCCVLYKQAYMEDGISN